MKTQIKTAIVALALAAATSAQAATYNGDLLIGFSSTTGNDVIYDLGSFASLVNGQQWNLSSLLGAYTLSTVNWGVVGNSTTAANGGIGTSRQIWTTRNGTPGPVTGNPMGASINTADGSMYLGFATAGAGQSLSILSTDDNSWNHQTINPTLTGQYLNVYGNPNTVGLSSIALWAATANNSAPTQLLNFSLGANGIVTYGTVGVVPEPGTYGALAGAGLLVVSLTNKLRRKQA